LPKAKRRTRLSVLVDEAAEGADAGVDTGKVGASAAASPGDDTDEGLVGIDERAARVTLARVATTSRDTSADHVGGNGEGAVVGNAGVAGHNGDADLEESSRGAATLTGSSPSSNGGSGSTSGVRARGGEGSKANVATGSDGARELPDGNVVVRGARRVAGVEDDAGDADDSAARVGAQRADTDSGVGDGANDAADGAVGSGNNGVAVDEGTTADVAATDLERDDEGVFTGSSGGSTNNGLLRNIIPLGSRSGEDERRKRSSDHRLETHGE